MGLEYAENDWILWEGQERSSLAFRYAIDHSPLTTRRLVKPGGAGGGRGRRDWKPQRLDRMREKIFLLLNDSRLHKRENSAIIYKKSQMRCDPPHQTRRCWVKLLLMVVNESFYTVMHDILYFLIYGNIWILYKACHTVVFIWLSHVCFFPWLPPPAWPTLTIPR